MEKLEALAAEPQNQALIKRVEDAFGSAGAPLQKPGRLLLGEGTLSKVCRKSEQLRQFFLFNDILIYGMPQFRGSYTKQRVLELISLSVQPVPGQPRALDLHSPQKSFRVVCNTAAEAEQWAQRIRLCSEDCRRRLGLSAGISPAAETSPIWVPDSAASVCMHCKTAQFGVVNRRHHCRRCGAVVCAPCSNRTWLFPSISATPQRVCLTCYNKLSSHSTAGASSSANADQSE
ncbi:hypothetical protein BOX15_Mlig002541g1 [Macrostomum lignano]|uniref:FYVE-type domain-containing protein n=1 Tax=Macrostomum lignano TaxID=282301 RepID=A0A267DNK1_9PLAT|nr:hypothetical protein BOX15_Mlig028570g4 [Macrostomum lignano]PAA70481.1 hypothetical protein BOX15_Mlig028570g1 [Macrostomum lignano]PAA84997.1 hypothetical protein BOX15_Mlig002541g1 [Macrostomum lignano]